MVLDERGESRIWAVAWCMAVCMHLLDGENLLLSARYGHAVWTVDLAALYLSLFSCCGSFVGEVAVFGLAAVECTLATALESRTGEETAGRFWSSRLECGGVSTSGLGTWPLFYCCKNHADLLVTKRIDGGELVFGPCAIRRSVLQRRPNTLTRLVESST